MAVSDSTVTRLGCTSRMPPATKTNSSPPSAFSIRTEPGLMRVISGVCLGKMPSSPASPGNATKRAAPEKMDSSALTTSTWMVFILGLLRKSETVLCKARSARNALHPAIHHLGSQLLGLFEGFVDGTDHVERLLGQMVALTGNDHLETTDGFGQRHVLARSAGKHFSHVERLRQETLNLTSTRHSQLVFGSQLIHTQNGDDVTQLFVALQRTLHLASHFVVLFANHLGVQLTAGGVQRVHGGVDTQRSDVTRQHHGRIQVGERCSRRWVGQVVRRHVHGLDRGDRTHFGRGDTLLQLAHFFGQGRLVAHGRRHTTQQSGHFGTSQGVTVDVVHKEQHVTAFITEGFCHGQASQRNAQTVAWRLVHLAIHHRHFGFTQVALVHHTGVRHLVVEVVTFTGTLTHTSKHGQARVSLSDVVDELHHVHGLAHTGTTEQAHLTALGEGADQVDHLNAGFQQFLRGGQFVVRRSLAVDRGAQGLIHRTALVDGVTQHVHDTAQGSFTHGHSDGVAGIRDHQAALQTVGRTQRNGTHHAVTELLLHFQSQGRAFELQRVVHLGHLVAWELHVHHSADTLNNLALYLSHSLLPSVCLLKPFTQRQRRPQSPTTRS